MSAIVKVGLELIPADAYRVLLLSAMSIVKLTTWASCHDDGGQAFHLMLLYKYCHPDRVDILLNGLIRFTQPSELNDVFEFWHLFEGVMPSWLQESLESIGNKYGQVALGVAVCHLLERLNAPDKAREILYALLLEKAGKVQIGDYFGRQLSSYVERRAASNGKSQESYSKHFGVLCLSETATNMLMWSHYADYHRGLVLEIDIDEAFPKRIGRDSVIGTPQKVIYDADVPALLLYDPLSKPLWERSWEVFLRKNIQWQHEMEWRLIFPLGRRPYPHTISEKCHLFPLERRGIKSVILGARASQETLESVKSALKQIPDLSHVMLWRSRPSDSTYELLVEKFDWPTLTDAPKGFGSSET